MADLTRTLEMALRKADALARQGDPQAAQDAKRLAEAYRSASQTTQTAQPAPEPSPAPQQPAAAPPEGIGSRIIGVANRVGNAVWDAGMAPIRAMTPDNLAQGAEGITNDMSAGMQGVNPVSVSKHRGQAVGVLKDGYVDVDGTRDSLKNYPADRFVTRQEGGQTYIYPRTPDMAENRLASAGRLLGYGVPTGNALRAETHAVQGVAKDAADLGVTPSFAMGGTARGKIAAAGEQFAPTASRFLQDGQRVSEEMGQAAFRLADRAGPGATPYEAGTAIQRGAERFVSGVKDRRTALYNAVDKAIPASTGLDAPATLAVIAREGEKLRKLPNTISADRLDALKSGKMTWEQARALRTDIGTALRSFDGSETNVAKGQLDQIYKALSTDLDATVKAAGPEAERAWSRANNYTRASQQRIDSAFGKVLGDKVTPEQAYDRLAAMAMEGGSRANLTSLNEMFRSLPKEDAAQVAGTVIRRLGRAANGAQTAEGEAWSAATFLTNWNKMSKPARRIIGRSGLDPSVGDELDKLARVAERAKETGAFRNHSNTGNAITAGGLGAGFYAAPISTIAATAIAHLSARAVTNVSFLRALNDAAAGRRSGLMAIAKSNSPLAIEAQTILRLPAPEQSSPQSQPRAGVPATR